MRRLQLFRTLILRPLRRDLLRTALTIISVALGVGVVIAIELAGDAATGSFRSSLETLVGKTDLEVVANGGVEEQWIARLSALPVNARFAPVIETQGLVERVGSVTVYGVDFVSQRGEAEASTPSLRSLDSSAIVSSGRTRPIGVNEGNHVCVTLPDRTPSFEMAR